MTLLTQAVKACVYSTVSTEVDFSACVTTEVEDVSACVTTEVEDVSARVTTEVEDVTTEVEDVTPASLPR